MTLVFGWNATVKTGDVHYEYLILIIVFLKTTTATTTTTTATTRKHFCDLTNTTDSRHAKQHPKSRHAKQTLWVDNNWNFKVYSYAVYQSKIMSSQPIIHFKVFNWYFRKYSTDWMHIWRLYFLFGATHCVKSVEIQSFFWSVFYRIWTRKSPVFGHFLHRDIVSHSTQNKHHRLTSATPQNVALIKYTPIM